MSENEKPSTGDGQETWCWLLLALGSLAFALWWVV